MLSLSNEVFKALCKYLSGDSNIGQFRDYMVGLRVDRYNLLASADKLFLNEFEGRYAEFSDFGGDESLLRASLASYVQSDAGAITPAYFWSFPSQQVSESPASSSVGSAPETRNCGLAAVAR